MQKKNKKTYFIFLFSLIVVAFVIGCKKDWLEAKSELSLTVPTTLNDLQGLLDDATVMNQQYPELGEVAADDFYVTDAVFSSAFNQLYKKDAYIWSKTGLHTKVSAWIQSYKKILIANVVLEGLNKITPTGDIESQQYNNIKGQALFIRGRVFFDLAQVYASAYQAQSAEQELAIVLRTSTDLEIVSIRSTVKQTYDQIIKDLTEAKSLLPVRPLHLTRASASTTNALLARVYLSMGDYGNSFLSAEAFLNQYNALLDYNEVSATANFIGRYNKEVLIHNNYLPAIRSVASNLIDPSLYNLYEANDLRRTRFFKFAANNTITFKGHYEDVTNNYFCGLATDEVYLTRAECHARAGRTTEAMKDLNDLLIKRWNKNVAYPALTAANADEALAIILRERRKELLSRGVRWMDLKRLNTDPRFASTITRTISGQTYTLEPNSYKYTFPIPDDIIQQTGMPQNPGWP